MGKLLLNLQPICVWVGPPQINRNMSAVVRMLGAAAFLTVMSVNGLKATDSLNRMAQRVAEEPSEFDVDDEFAEVGVTSLLQAGFEMQGKQRSASEVWDDLEEGGLHDALAQATSLLKRP